MSSYLQNNHFAKHYASILYSLAKDSANAQDVKAQLNELLGAYKATTEFVAFCANPIISKKVKIATIEKIAKECDFNDLVKNLLMVLAKNNRLSLLDDIVEAFVKLKSEDKGEVVVEVTSANKLSANQQKNIKENLEKTFNAPIILQLSTDASLIAGVKIKYGSHELDASAQGVLRNAESRLYAAIEKTEMV
jgi:F-type H+-transporting ATPase subunit delta